MDNFYYNLLNIKGLPTKEELFDKIEEVLKTEIDPLREDNPKLELLCKIVSILVFQDLKKKGIKSKIVRTNDLFNMYEHHFVITSYMDNNEVKHVLIDPTFNQFENEEPEKILKSTSEGKFLYDNLIKNGYSNITDNDLKLFIVSLGMNNEKITIDDVMLERRHR